MHKRDQSSAIRGTGKSDELLGGPGKDTIRAHFGHGAIDRGPGIDTLYISRRARKAYKIKRCETISYKTLGC